MLSPKQRRIEEKVNNLIYKERKRILLTESNRIKHQLEQEIVILNDKKVAEIKAANGQAIKDDGTTEITYNDRGQPLVINNPRVDGLPDLQGQRAKIGAVTTVEAIAPSKLSNESFGPQ